MTGLANYKPHREQTIDEAMIAFKGRLSFKQYLPAKPTKFGIKVWVRADSHNGYVHQFQVYTGAVDNVGNRQREEGLRARVVKDLTMGLAGKNHHVYMDNYFTSPKLFEDLLSNNIFACGTVRVNRKGFPPSLKAKNVIKQRGESKILQKEGTVAVAWRDKRIVNFLATNENPTAMETTRRRLRDGTQVDVQCPKVVSNYGKYMAGADRADQLRMGYSTCRKAKKWWKYMFWFLLDISVCNSLITMKQSPNHQLQTRRGRPKSRKQLDFRMALAEQLLHGYHGNRKQPATPNVDVEGNFHWPTKFEKRGRCHMCSRTGQRREVVSGCKQCAVPLCLDCFEPYHSGPDNNTARTSGAG